MARQTGQQRQESQQQRRQQKPARVVRRGQRAILNGKRVIADGKGNWMPESHYDRYSKDFKKGKPVGTYTVGKDRSQPAATAADIARSDAQYRASGGKTGVGRRASTTSSRSGSKGAKGSTQGRTRSADARYSPNLGMTSYRGSNNVIQRGVFARKNGKPGYLNKSTGKWSPADASDPSVQRAARRHDTRRVSSSSGRTSVGSRRNVTPTSRPAASPAPRKRAATAEEGRMIWARKYSADKYKDQAIGKEARRYLAKQKKTKTLRKEAQATYNRGSA